MENEIIEGHNKPLVMIARCNQYLGDQVRQALIEVLEPFGGITAFVKPGQKVLLKPNLLAGVLPAEAVTTHPALVRAAVELVLESGGKAYIGDSPGSDDQLKAHRKAGYAEIAAETGAELIIFNPTGKGVKGAKTLAALPLAAELEQMDFIINLGKLKTHSLTGLTGAVKNTYGCIVRAHKKRFHLEYPLPLRFSDLLVDVCLAVNPGLSIIDAVVAMEGAGPRSGSPRKIGLLMGSVNPFALDSVAAQITGFNPEQVTTITAARERKISGAGPGDYRLIGLSMEESSIENFDRGPAASGQISSILVNFPVAWVRNFIYARRPYPVIEFGKCTGCALCSQNCPAGIIEMKAHIPDIDLYDCIRCYCCQEHCPSGAIRLTKKPG